MTHTNSLGLEDFAGGSARLELVTIELFLYWFENGYITQVAT